MLWPFPGNTNITTPWDDPRPITNRGQHPHGAIDIGLKVGSKIIAPERGDLYKYCAIRYADGQVWPGSEMPEFPFRNYFYDMFGGLFVLRGESGLTHVFAHIYQNQLFNKEEHEWNYIEQKEDSRWPLHCYIAGPFEIFEGWEIGETGNSGFSTGPHCHYETHEGWKWQNWKDRPDPAGFAWDEFR